MKRQTPRAIGPADEHSEGFIRTLLAGPNGRLAQAFENAWTSPHTSRVEANAERGITRFLVDRSLPNALGRYELFSIRDQIRVVIEAGLPLSYLWQDLSARDRAITLFGKLRVWDTEANNGVLVYLLLAEQAIEIVADRGLSPHVSAAHWQALIAPMREAFRQGRFEPGLADAVAAIDTLLRTHFPLGATQSNPNELPNRPLMR